MDSDIGKIGKLKCAADYSLWKFQIKTILNDLGIFGIVCGKEKKPQNEQEDNPQAVAEIAAKIEEWTKRDNKAQRVIATTVEKPPLLHIITCDTANQMWIKLQNVFEQKNESSVHYLQQKFFSFQKEQSDDIASFMSKLEELVQQLKDLGEEISEKMVMGVDGFAGTF